MYAGFCVAVAEVMLWRRKKVTLGILFVALAAWVVFEGSGYTLLSLVSSVLLLLAIVFLWTKSAEILNSEECKKDVPVVLIDMHNCSLESRIKMNLGGPREGSETSNSSSVAVAFSAAVATVVRAPPKDFMVVREEWAAIWIQTTSRA
ncbi:hypothetical protein NE237_003568 [Protea cynaroides]|uniref:Reticulon-like protein n=1 Tax=Protea cynaroides TaxID=273540 RepID=A0A9Q0QSV1_9MAGN|nr:hypothetical protein NE237_003568 [Protea cynaroides]